MNLVLVIIINIILLFIIYVVLSAKIRSNSAPSLLERYTKEVENLIIQLNSALDDVVNIAEEKIEELKGFIDSAEKLLKNPKVKKAIGAAGDTTSLKSKKTRVGGIPPSEIQPNLLERTKHLLAMGHTKDEIAKILNINRAEVEFLEALSKK
jgi:hypothetical protein